MREWNGRWPGGRTFLDRHGKTRWQLERMHNGVRYSRRLDARNESEALAELALFERDPDAYLTKAEAVEKAQAEAVLMDAELVARFLAHLKTEGRTERYRRSLRTYLAQWAESLAGRDLREVTLQEFKRELAKNPTARKHRIIAIKSFFSFLREVEAVLSPAQDATLGLKVPPARPEKARRKKGYTMQEVEAFYRAISGWASPKLGGLKTDVQAVRDIFVLHAKTGMHRSEIERVARGDCELKPVEHSEIRGVVRFTHKSGRIHTQSLDAQSFMAAQRLQARGGAPADSWVRKVLRHTAKILDCEPIKLGQMRHSFVSWALTHGVEARPAEGGVPLATVASIVGHTSANTTSRFYDVTEVKPMIRLPLRLEHPEDPVPLPLPDRQLRNLGG
ncbi:MAG TPA: site-specific integrase [Hyalangium sp.]|jgi:integrase|nr:site-specific integrase [Hyalangium sp.]